MAMQARRAWGRGFRPMGNVEIGEEIRRLQTQLEAFEVGIQKYLDARDISEPKEEVEEEGVACAEEPLEINLLRLVPSSGWRPKVELSTYDGSLVV